MDINERLQNSAAEWVDSKKKTEDLKRNFLKIKMIAIGVGLLILAFLASGVLSYFTEIFN